jgi:hypothetical protein
MNGSASARIREFWPLVRVLRREGVSWRKMPQEMRRRFGVQLVSHVLYVRLAHDFGDIGQAR